MDKKIKIHTITTLISIVFSFLVIDSAFAMLKEPLKNSSGFILANKVFSGKFDIDVDGIKTPIPLQSAMENDKIDIPKNVMTSLGLFEVTKSTTGFIFQQTPTYNIEHTETSTFINSQKNTLVFTGLSEKTDTSGFRFYDAPYTPTPVKKDPVSVRDPILADLAAFSSGFCISGCASGDFDVVSQSGGSGVTLEMKGDVPTLIVPKTDTPDPNTSSTPPPSPTGETRTNYVSFPYQQQTNYLDEIIGFNIAWKLQPETTEIISEITNKTPTTDVYMRIFVPNPDPEVNSAIFAYNYERNSDYIPPKTKCVPEVSPSDSIKIDLNNPGSGKGRVLISANGNPYVFTGFSGDCTGTSSCAIENLDVPKAVIASFGLPTISACDQ